MVGIGNSAADITVELSSKALGNQVTLSTRSSAWIVPKYIAGRPGDMFWRTSPHLPLAWQRKAAQWVAPVLGADPTMYGLPPADHKLFEAHPTQSVELPLRLGSGDVTPKPNVARLDGQHRALRRRQQCRFRCDHLRDRLQHHLPVLRPRGDQRAGQPDPALQADVPAGVDDVVFIGFAQAVPTLFPFVECQSRLLAAYAIGRYALPSGRGDGARHRRRSADCTPAIAPIVRGTPSRWTTSSMNTTSAGVNCPRDCGARAGRSRCCDEPGRDPLLQRGHHLQRLAFRRPTRRVGGRSW